ncbi:MAG: HIT family protein [Bacteroidetes bacterium]|nr:HIT family protein [Bacteroidota bacterium]
MSTIFSKIINRELPAYIIHEDEDHLAFLDINPLKEGHTLVIPKEETDYIFDMSSDRFLALFSFSKEVAKKLKAEISCRKIGMAVIGLEVSHAHIHLIPIDSVSDMNFSNHKLTLSQEFAEDLVKKFKKK